MTVDTTSPGYGDDGMDATSAAGPRPAARAGGDETRAALLQAAHDLVADEGPSALSVRRIAAAAGVSTMNVYSRFGGKTGVLDELWIDGFRRLGEAMAEFPPTDDPLENLRRCGRAYRAFARANPTYYSLMFDRVVPDFEPSDAGKAVALESLGQVVERVQAAMDAGAIPEGDAFSVAVGLWACEHGLVSLEMRTEQDELFDWEAIAPATVAALVHGLASGAGATEFPPAAARGEESTP